MAWVVTPAACLELPHNKNQCYVGYVEKPVLILGGGVAGLGAARELARHGVAVTVIEAKKRLGGRIHTIREGSLPIELGAEFVHGRNRPLLKAIRQAGLSLHSLADSHQLFEAGQLQPVRLWQQIDDIIGRVDFHKQDQSFKEWLARQSLKQPDRQMAIDFVEGFDAAKADRISAHALRQAQQAADSMDGDRQYRINEGYSALVRFLAEEIKAKGGVLLKSAQARHIQWQPGYVEVRLRRGGRTETRSGAAAVFTLPLGVWKTGSVAIHPPLVTKEEAVRKFEFGNVVKVTFVFRDRWWGEFSAGFMHAPDEPLPTWWSDPRGPILTGWAGGPKADALLRLTPSKLEKLGLNILGKIFPERASLLSKQHVATHAWNWAHDPHVRGAYSYIPVNGLDLPATLAAPVGNTLFFAGEATVADAQTGTVFGALESGLRAARELLDVLRTTGAINGRQ